MLNQKSLKAASVALALSMAITATSCAAIDARGSASDDRNKSTSIGSDTSDYTAAPVSADDINIEQEIMSSGDGDHAIQSDGQTESLSNVKIIKTGDSDAGDEADFYGDNSAVFATNQATLTLTNMIIDTNGKHANAVFSYGEGTTVNISNSVITTEGNCSGGLMTTGGGKTNASNLSIHTTGNSSAAIRSDRGGGTVNVDGGTYTTDGVGSPAIYSTADITVSNAKLESTSSQGVVVEGENSVSLNNVALIADNNSKNSDKSSYYQAVMIYQSMSGDADEGTASFSMKGGSITNANGDIFFVNNTVTKIALEGVEVINQDPSGVFLRAEAAGWGSEGSNGGKVELTLKGQTLTGDIVTDEISAINMYLTSGSSYEGTVNGDNSGKVYVNIESGSSWTLTGDSYITALTCDKDGIVLNGHKLYVNGVEYQEGSASTGDAIELTSGTSSGSGHGQRPDKPDGERPPEGEHGKPGDTPPDGDSGNPGDTPPSKPDQE